MRRWNIRIAASLSAIAFAASDALACSCLTPQSPCAVLKERESVVFVGTVTDIAPASRAGSNARSSEAALSVRFSVGERFGDTLDGTAVVSTSDSAGTCGYRFSVGESYLVYAYRTPDGLSTSVCSRTAPLAAARDDLEVLRDAGRGAVRARLHGSVALLVSTLNGSLVSAIAGTLPNITVVATRDPEATRESPPRDVASRAAMRGERHETVTDATGEFRFMGLDQGWYTVRAEAEQPLKSAFDRAMPVYLDGCSASTDVLLTVEALTGTIRRSDGSPVGRDLQVSVVSVDQVDADHSALDFTDVDGRWRIDGLSDGRYLVSINALQAPTAAHPYPPVWYPGVADVSKAEVIALVENRPRRLDFTLPAPLPVRAIRGVVLDAAGRLVAGADVEIADRAFPTREVGRVSTDVDGRFSIDAVVGRQLIARARHYTRAGTVESDPVDVTVDATCAAGTSPLTLMVWKQRTPSDGEVR